jgi:hypothetical protein
MAERQERHVKRLAASARSPLFPEAIWVASKALRPTQGEELCLLV